jgi:predicted nucleotidyltransferase
MSEQPEENSRQFVISIAACGWPQAGRKKIDLVGLKDFLEDRLGWPVDVVTKAGLEPGIRDRVLREAASVF